MALQWDAERRTQPASVISEMRVKFSKKVLHFIRWPAIITKLLRKNNRCACGLVAQLDRVFDYESKGRGFESRRAHQENPPEIRISGGFLFVTDAHY